MFTPGGISKMNLTPRQIEVVTHLANGSTVKQIAAVLNLSPKTVEFHSLKARRLIGHESIAMLTRYAVAKGFVSPLPV